EPIRPPEPGGPGQPSAARTSADGVGAIEATASDLLLWLYQRVELDTSGVPTEVVHRFRELTFTD
ncbi:MAG: hypothetical protein ACRDP4_15560, partial [Nocardioidaceae bacterium]